MPSAGKTRTSVKRIKFLLIGMVIGLAIGIIGLLLIQNASTSDKEQSVQPSVVFNRIVSRSELVSASQQYSITDKSTQDPAMFFNLFNIPFTDTSFWYRYVGTIKAGVNLSDAEFDQTGNVITVTLSAPYIISNTPNMDESGVIEQNNNLFASVPLNEVDAFQRQCVKTSEEQAIEGGLLDEAKSEAEQDITDMFTAALGDAYQIQFEWQG